MTETTILSGMKAIQEHCRTQGLQYSESSVIQLIRGYGLPAKKLQGIWIADKIQIADWLQDYLRDPEKGNDQEKKPESGSRKPQKQAKKAGFRK